MKRLFLVTATTTFCFSQLAMAQAPAPANPGLGFYLEGVFGLTLLDEATFDTDLLGGIVNLDFDPTNDIGPNVGAAFGVALPLSNFKLRFEGEVAIRGNTVSDIENLGDEFETINDSSIYSVSGMANTHADLYVTQHLALSVGGGLGYASVGADIAADVDGDGISFIDDESDTVFAYQLMAGVRYDIGQSTVSLGYRYFATDDPEFEVDGSDGALDYTTEYATHNFNVGYAYNF